MLRWEAETSEPPTPLDKEGTGGSRKERFPEEDGTTRSTTDAATTTSSQGPDEEFKDSMTASPGRTGESTTEQPSSQVFMLRWHC